MKLISFFLGFATLFASSTLTVGASKVEGLDGNKPFKDAKNFWERLAVETYDSFPLTNPPTSAPTSTSTKTPTKKKAKKTKAPVPGNTGMMGMGGQRRLAPTNAY